MKITKPSDLKDKSKEIEEVVLKFEEEFKNVKDYSIYYTLIIEGEYERSICDEIEKTYVENGWKNVECKTCSENGRKYRFTSLKLWR